MLNLLFRAVVSAALVMTMLQAAARASPEPFELPLWLVQSIIFANMAIVLWFIWELPIRDARARAADRGRAPSRRP